MSQSKKMVTFIQQALETLDHLQGQKGLSCSKTIHIRSNAHHKFLLTSMYSNPLLTITKASNSNPQYPLIPTEQRPRPTYEFLEKFQRRGGHFQSKNLYCRFWTFIQGFFRTFSKKIALQFSENEGGRGSLSRSVLSSQ